MELVIIVLLSLNTAISITLLLYVVFMRENQPIIETPKILRKAFTRGRKKPIFYSEKKEIEAEERDRS